MLKTFMQQLNRIVEKAGPGPRLMRRDAYIAAVDRIHLLTDGDRIQFDVVVGLFNLAQGHKN